MLADGESIKASNRDVFRYPDASALGVQDCTGCQVIVGEVDGICLREYRLDLIQGFGASLKLAQLVHFNKRSLKTGRLQNFPMALVT